MFLSMIKHYFKRIMQDPIMVGVYFFLPVGLVVLQMMMFNYNVEGEDHLAHGYNMIATFMVAAMLVLFQIFSSSTIIDYLHMDVHGDRKWRLLAAPTNFAKFIAAACVAAVIFSMLSGVILLVVGGLVFDAYLFSIPVTLVVMFMLSLMAQFFGMLLFLFFKKKAHTEAIIMVTGFAMSTFAGEFVLGQIDFGVDFLNNFFQRYTPYALGRRAISYAGTLTAECSPLVSELRMEGNNMSGAIINIGILTAITLVIGVAAYVIQRRRGV